jgi:hypothetical protein
MKDWQADALVDALCEAGIDAHVEADYSGRGMYGETTHAVYTRERVGLGTVLIIWQRDQGEDFKPPSIRVDDMGMGSVLY